MVTLNVHKIHNDSTPVQNTEIFEGNFFNHKKIHVSALNSHVTFMLV